ncbi:MAG: hypothetical protein O3B47_05360 [bacterium]|nr:hypothetical protein [bacterium]
MAIIKQDRIIIEAVASRKSATGWGIFILIFPPIVNLFLKSLQYKAGLSSIFSPYVFWVTFVPAISLIGAIFALSICAEQFFSRSVSHTKLFRVLSYASLFLWLGILPFILELFDISLGFGLFNIIWMLGFMFMLLAGYLFLTSHHRLSQKDGIICLLVAVVAYFILNSVLGNMLVGSGYRIFY